MISTTVEKSTDGIEGIYVTRQQLLQLKDQPSAAIARQTRSPAATFIGDLLSLLKGHGIEFADIRPYQPGDEVRHIDWRTTARTGIPYTREYIKESQQSVYLAVDQRLTMFFGSGQEFKSVCAARLATLVAWASAGRGLKLGATVVGEWPQTKTPNASDRLNTDQPNDNTNATPCYSGSVRTGPARKTTLALINELSVTNNALSADCAPETQATDSRAAASRATVSTATAGLQQLLEQTNAHAQARSTVYLISDFHGFNADCAHALTRLGKRCTLVMIMISDNIEEAFDVAGSIGISDGRHRSVVQLSTAKRKQYVQQRQAFHETLQRSADMAGATLMHHVLASTAPA